LPATCLRRAGGLPPAERRPAHLVCDARSGRSRDLSLLAPVGETHPEAQTRRDRETSAALRFRGALFSPVTPEVGAAASPPLPLPLRASAAARDAPQSGGRERPPSHDTSRPSRRGPPQQRHADWELRASPSSWGTSNPKSEIRNFPAGRPAGRKLPLEKSRALAATICQLLVEILDALVEGVDLLL